MTLLDINSRVANALSAAETDLRAVALEAAREVQAAAAPAEAEAAPVILQLEEGLKAAVDGFRGAITIEGNPVGNVVHLLTVIKALEAEVGNLQKAEPQLEKAAEDAANAEKAEAPKVEAQVVAGVNQAATDAEKALVSPTVVSTP